MVHGATQRHSGLVGLSEMFPDSCSQGSPGDVPIPVLREGLPKCLTTSRVSSPSFNIQKSPKTAVLTERALTSERLPHPSPSGGLRLTSPQPLNNFSWPDMVVCHNPYLSLKPQTPSSSAPTGRGHIWLIVCSFPGENQVN